MRMTSIPFWYKRGSSSIPVKARHFQWVQISRWGFLPQRIHLFGLQTCVNAVE